MSIFVHVTLNIKIGEVRVPGCAPITDARESDIGSVDHFDNIRLQKLPEVGNLWNLKYNIS